ncbi:MAG: sulfotransferase [Caulobacteraceae bacterium]|nr:sulfotransferase [Caulobacteraceae bacterium]
MTVLADEVHALASEMTGGLTDFGPDDYLVGLRVLLEAAASSPHAGAALDARVRQTAAAVLASRLWSQWEWSRRPELLKAPLARQVVVVGLPRSGTTALHQMLAADPAYQWIPAWIAPHPRPRPPRPEWEADPEYRARLGVYRAQGPNPLHDVAPDDPEECIQLMRQSFVSMMWVSSLPVPAYHAWFIEQDERPSYRRLADNLRLISGGDTVSPWLLKNPSHTFGMDAMLETFPDAVFVHIYRDPAETIVSGCSLIATQGRGEGAFAPAELGAHRLRIWALAGERLAAAREAHPQRKFVDVDYRAFIADPLAAAEQIYRGLSRELSPQARAAMQTWLRERPKDKHGAHRYAPEDFGLTNGGIRERMAAYIGRYGL